MTGRKISFYILAGFIVGTIFLIYIQFNSAKNISTLISGNEKLLAEFKVNAVLKELEKDVVTIESKVRGTVATGDTSYIEGLEKNITQIESDIEQLKKISDDDSSILYINELDSLVHKKLLFNRKVLATFHLEGKNSAEKLIASRYGKRLTDAIIASAQNIDSTRKNHLADTTILIDKSGKKAQQLSTILIVLVLISGAVLLWFIINTIRKQISLIQQLSISEKKLKESTQVKENFMANMSHEIRTPMNAILGFTHLLRHKNLDEESKEYLKTIQKSGESLLTIINDILDLSKIEAGMVRIESAPFSMRELLHSIEVMLKPKVAEKKLQLSVRVDESLPDILEGDATRLTQILVNLIGNALKFTDKGSVSINITNKEIINNIVKAGITVSDTGIGVESEKLQHIFDRFQQAEDSVTRKYGGTGLGLSIAKDLTLLQNGTIDIESEPGKGTTFRLIIPYKISSGELSTEVSGTYNFLPKTNFEHVCILVVEDNEINQSLVRHLFKSWQIDFDLAMNGKEAISKLQLKKYDLVLMDIQMPEMDGYTATQEIRNSLKLTLPIIAMTAHALAGEREKCLSYGMNEYLSKPIREDQLHKLIAEFILPDTAVTFNKDTVANIPAGNYKYIDLQYMKEVGGGNIEYEKTVTEQFMEAIPGDLQLLEKAWQDNNVSYLRQVAHNMKTTVSVMGLNEVLQPYLDAIEYDNLNEKVFRNNFFSVKFICEASVEEAKKFYNSL